MRMRGQLGVLVAAIASGCFEDSTPPPSSGTTTPGTDDTIGPGPTADDSTSGGADATAGSGPTAGTGDETATDTGELPPPMCGDGTPVPGELCYGDTSVVMANDPPASARLGDVTGNASVDLVYLAASQVVVHAGDGGGNFGPAIFDAAVGGLRFELADFDGDGELDMAALESGGPLRLLLGSGGASFASSDQVVVGSDPQALALGDLDGDGAMDAVVGTAATGLLFVVLGGGDGSLSPEPAVLTGADAHGLALGDLDGDGNLDVALALRGAQPGVAVAMGDGSGGLSTPAVVTDGSSGARAVVAGDLDGDGRTDLAYLADDGDVLGVLRSDGAGGFEAEQVVGTGAGPSVLLAADLRRDGHDVLVVGHAGENALRVYGLEGGAPTELLQVMLVAPAAALHHGDVNDDDVLDLAVTSSAPEIVTLVLSTP